MTKDRAYAIRLLPAEWAKLEALAANHKTAASKVAREIVLRELGRYERPLEHRAEEWVNSRLGSAAMAPSERALRLLEEAIELAQAEGITYGQILAQATHVFDRPAGEALDEGGGVAFTLFAWAACRNTSVRDLAVAEIARLAGRPSADVRVSVDRKLAAGLMNAPAAPRTWTAEWDWMLAHKDEAWAHFMELAAGREVPGDFTVWPRERKIKWLEANWPLEN